MPRAMSSAPGTLTGSHCKIKARYRLPGLSRGAGSLYFVQTYSDHPYLLCHVFISFSRFTEIQLTYIKFKVHSTMV